jgi:hypothetical protein
MDDQTMFDLFDSLKREIKQEMQPVKDGLERIESRLVAEIHEHRLDQHDKRLDNLH